MQCTLKKQLVTIYGDELVTNNELRGIPVFSTKSKSNTYIGSNQNNISFFDRQIDFATCSKMLRKGATTLFHEIYYN